VFPLLLTVVTGTAYRVARAWFDAPKPSVHWLLNLHDMSVIGLHAFYPLVIGCSALALSLTGARLLKFDSYLLRMFKRVTSGASSPVSPTEQTTVSIWPSQWTARATHRLTVSFMLLPLFITSATGVLYTVVRHWAPAGSYDPNITKLLMGLHQGTVLVCV
jgi:hypothetical protein